MKKIYTCKIKTENICANAKLKYCDVKYTGSIHKMHCNNPPGMNWYNCNNFIFSDKKSYYLHYIRKQLEANIIKPPLSWHSNRQDVYRFPENIPLRYQYKNYTKPSLNINICTLLIVLKGAVTWMNLQELLWIIITNFFFKCIISIISIKLFFKFAI